MKILVLSVALLFATGFLLSACGGNGGDTARSLETTRADRGRAVLDGLPICPEATAVREFHLANNRGPDDLARDYALATAPEHCLRSLFKAMTASGWQKSRSIYTKDGNYLRWDIPGRELPPLDSAYTVSKLADSPVGTQIYFTLAVSADLQEPSSTSTSNR